MSAYIDKPLSLVERKKLQWAKEREELAELCGLWTTRDSQSFDRSFGRNRYASKLSMANNEFYRKDSIVPNRRSSLPPLYKNQYNSVDREREMGGETSGYGSDNPNQANEYTQPVKWNQCGYESSSSYRDDRLKWHDKNYGKFWDSKEESYEKTHEPPNWVKRGLQRDEEIIVSNTSPAESPQQDDGDPNRPYTNSSRTYIRGQNIPMDSMELAEREKRRQVALAHQEAIRQQLEEREKWRKLERERKIKEEKEEELRIERDQEIERLRKENELKIIKEKQERETKRKQAIREAIELAEKEAKMEKMKLKEERNNNYNINIAEENEIQEKKKIYSEIKNYNNNNSNNNKENQNMDNGNNKEEKNSNLEQNNNILIISPRQQILNNEINNLQPPVAKTLNITRTSENKDSTPSENLNNQSDNTLHNFSSPRIDNLALVLQTPIESLQNMQYAVLMSALGTATPAAIPIAVPVTVTTERTNSSTTARTENRILTPTQYRNKNRKLCDSSTQTEYFDFNRTDTADTVNNQKCVGEKMNHLEMGYDNRSRRERRSRIDDRNRENMEERPKWGVNRPPTRYLKQSEKDPLYQRRKLREKMRDTKMYDYKNSSDESQTGSPKNYRKNYTEKRHTRALWRKNDHFFARNIRMYQTEIVPLDSDKDQIYYKHRRCDQCCCRCSCERRNNTADVLKIEQNSPRESVQYKSEIIQRPDRLPNYNGPIENNDDIIDKLATTLHEGLLSKHEHWDHSPRTASLSSSTRNTENN